MLAVTLIVIGGILSIIGVIGGEILGLWRVGTSSDSGRKGDPSTFLS